MQEVDHLFEVLEAVDVPPRLTSDELLMEIKNIKERIALISCEFEGERKAPKRVPLFDVPLPKKVYLCNKYKQRKIIK